jgi:predicted acylesterase/phospholipase RssA
MTQSNIIPPKQRALILQGGGALGAYEAGVFEVIYNKIKEEDSSSWKTHMFDIIAGASIGSINAIVLVNHFLKSKSWDKAPETLKEFWEGMKNQTWVENANPSFKEGWKNYWNFWSAVDHKIASPEAARRYWSWMQLSNFPLMGARNLSMTIPQFTYKFLDLNPMISSWLAYDFEPLKTHLGSSINFPIKTSFTRNEPRMLLVSIDVQDCSEATVFDSYEKKKGEWYSEYGEEGNRHRICYEGIGLDQLLSSCLFPFALYHPSFYDEETKTSRTFWDGAFISNTPLREVLHHHREFWLRYFDDNKIAQEKRRVPDLEIYIVNLYPSKEKNIPGDIDEIRDREIDIKFHDRTVYDEKVAHMVTDYITLAERLVALAKEKGAMAEVNKILETPVSASKGRGGSKRTYQSLLEGRFATRVHRFDRQDDGNTIFGKHADFSNATIEELMTKGIEDAKRHFDGKRT